MRDAIDRVLVLSVVVLVAACGGGGDAPDAPTVGDAAAIDARPAVDAIPGLGCLGQPPPAGSGAVSIDGAVLAVEAYAVEPVAGAAVELRRRGDDGIVGQATTAADGKFTIAADAPVDGYFIVTSAGHLPTYAFDDIRQPTGDDALLLVADAAELARWYADAGDTYAAGARTVITAVRDCDHATADTATVAIAPAPGELVYYDAIAMQWDPALTAATNGFALATDVAGAVTITPAFGGVTFPAEPIAALPDALTIAVVSPYQ
jgi:hypothetical protein